MTATGALLRRVLFAALLVVVTRPAFQAEAILFQTSVEPQSAEDLAAACHYELTILNPSRPVTAIWVIFDRGRDMQRYYGDPDVQRFANQHAWALLFAFHCPAKSFTAPKEQGDINPEPSTGLGRALLAAIAQLSQTSRHRELVSAKLVLLGFSGAGSLVARLTDYAPERIAAVIAADAGHFDPYGMDTVQLSSKAAAIPQLILTGGQDAVSGVPRPYAYFRQYFDAGAPWMFVVQNQTPHCCIVNAKSLVLEWLDAVVGHTMVRGDGFYGFITKGSSANIDCPAPGPANPVWCRGGRDTWGEANWSVAAATVGRQPVAPVGMLPAGWLPTRAIANHWKAFVTQPTHPITSLP